MTLLLAALVSGGREVWISTDSDVVFSTLLFRVAVMTDISACAGQRESPRRPGLL